MSSAAQISTAKGGELSEQRANCWSASAPSASPEHRPLLTLTNATTDGTADEDVAWDAVALPGLFWQTQPHGRLAWETYPLGVKGSRPGRRRLLPELTGLEQCVSGDKTKNTPPLPRHAWARRAVLPGEQLGGRGAGGRLECWMDSAQPACSVPVTTNIPQQNAPDGWRAAADPAGLPRPATGRPVNRRKRHGVRRCRQEMHHQHLRRVSERVDQGTSPDTGQAYCRQRHTRR